MVKGPRSILPPKEIDDFGWLEPHLKLVWQPYIAAPMESLIIFCDNTVNRDKGFLEPVIRYARWERRKDLERPNAWPSVQIMLSYLGEHLVEVNERVKTLQAGLAKAPFVPFGLSMKRDAPQLKTSSTGVYLHIMSWNAAQTLEYWSPPLEEDHLTDLFFETFDYLKSIMQPIDRKGWREAYNFDLSYYHPFRSWYWSGNPPTIKKIQRTQPQETE